MHLLDSKKVSQILMGSKRRISGAAVQRYYPQCSGCSSKQSSAVKMAKDMLVFHYYGMRPWYYAGEQKRFPPCPQQCPLKIVSQNMLLS